jgi:antitoxin YefM
MHSAPLTEIRDRLSEIVDEVSTTGTEYTVTRHGRAAAVILAHDDYEALLETLNILSDHDAMAAITEARAEFDAEEN